MSGRRTPARVVVRLDAVGAGSPALRAIASLAHIMEAEFAARFVEDRRLIDALAFASPSPDQEDQRAALRFAERTMRRQVERIAVELHAAWSFDIATCSGIFAAECALHQDDLLAITLPDVEQMMSTLRDEISMGLTRAAGVLLMPRIQPPAGRPVVGMVMREASLSHVVDTSIDIAARTRQPLAFVVADDGDLLALVRKAVSAQWIGQGSVALHSVPTHEIEFLAAKVRSLKPRLVVAAPPKAVLTQILARMRLLREVAAPILLLPTEVTARR